MKIETILVIVGIALSMVGCTKTNNQVSNQPGSPAPLDTSNLQIYQQAKAEFDVSTQPDGSASYQLVKKSYAATNCTNGQCTDYSDITITNNSSTQFALISSQSQQAINAGAMNNNLSSIVNLQVGTLFDNNMFVCGGFKCTSALVRIYTTGSNGGLYNSANQQSIPLLVSGPDLASPVNVPLNSATGQVVQSLPISQSKQVISLVAGDFSGALYNLSANFAQAGAGSFKAHVVVEYDLASSNGIGVAPISLLNISTPAQNNVLAGTCSSVVTVQSQDASGNPTATSSDINVTINSNGITAYSDSNCQNSEVVTKIPSGQNGVNVFFKSNVVNSYTLSFDTTNFPELSQGMNVVPAAPASILVDSGNNQGGTAGSLLTNPLAVIVKDSFGNVIPGASIDWTTNTGSVLSGLSSSTGLNGKTSETLTLSPVAGPDVATATINQTSISVNFSATGNPGVPASIAVGSGNNQTAIAGSVLANPLVAIVKDSLGNTVPNVTVDWVANNGSTLANSSNPTAIDGTTTNTLTLGLIAGTNTATATIHQTSISTSFSETGIAGVATIVVANAGNTQIGTVGAPLPGNLLAKVQDTNGNAISGVQVDWAILSGGGSLGSASSSTNFSGIASNTLTLGSVAGSNTISATLHSNSSLIANFSENANPGSPSSLAIVSENIQTIARNKVTNNLRVQVTDSFGNGISGVQVQYTTPSTIGSLVNGSKNNTFSISTGPTGLADAFYYSGSTIESTTVSAKDALDNLTLSSPFNVAVVDLSPTAVTISMNGQADYVSIDSTVPPVNAVSSPVTSTGAGSSSSGAGVGGESAPVNPAYSPFTSDTSKIVSQSDATDPNAILNVIISATLPSSPLTVNSASCSVTADSIAALIGESIPSMNNPSPSSTFSFSRSEITTGSLKVAVTSNEPFTSALDASTSAAIATKKYTIKQVSNLIGGATEGNDSPSNMTLYNNSLYYTAANNSGVTKFYKYNGTTSTIIGETNKGGNDYSSGSNPMMVFENTLYLIGNVNAAGVTKLFRYCDSGAGCSNPGLSMAVSINPPATTDAISGLTIFNGELYFAANNTSSFNKLYSFDGSTLTQVSNVDATGTDLPTLLLATSSGLYFEAAASTSSFFNGFFTQTIDIRKLFKYCDGNSNCGGSAGVIQISNTSGSSTTDDNISQVIEVSNNIYFTATNSSSQIHIFRFPENGTISNQDCVVNTSSSDGSFNLVNYNNNLYFVASNASGQSKLYECNGAAGGTPSNVYQTNPSGDDGTVSLTAGGPNLYIVAKTSTAFSKLFKYCDGNVSCGASGGTQVSNTAGSSTNDFPSSLAYINGDLYFQSSVSASAAFKAFAYSGSGSPVQLPSTNTLSGGNDNPEFFSLGLNNNIYYQSGDSLNTAASGFSKLYVYNGTNASLVSDNNSGNGNKTTDGISYIVPYYGSVVVFAGSNSSRLYRFDGTTFAQVSNINSSNDNVANITVYNGAVYFTANNSSGSNKLFRYCESAAGCSSPGISQVSNLTTSSDAISPISLYNNALYFSANLPSFLVKVFRYCDGTAGCGAAGITQVSNLTSLNDEQNQSFISMPCNGSLFFSAYITSSGTNRLYKYNGSTITQISNNTVTTSASSSGDNATNLVCYNNTLYFSMDESQTANTTTKLFKYCDGSASCGGTSGIIQVSNTSGSETSLDSPLVVGVYNDKLFFSALNPNGVDKLYKYCDGSAGCGTTGVFQLSNSSGSSTVGDKIYTGNTPTTGNYQQANIYGNALYFIMNNSSGGRKLFRYCDGASNCGGSEVLEQVSNIDSPESMDIGNFSPSVMGVSNNYLYFVGQALTNITKMYRVCDPVAGCSTP